MLNLHPIPAYIDNYIWCFHNSSQAYVVDPGDANCVQKYLDRHELTLLGILVTHHHWDHVTGIEALINRYPGITVWGPQAESIPCCNEPVSEGDRVQTKLDVDFEVLAFPGHTLGHVGYYAEQGFARPLIFCGDTLFSAGCGRLFEGSPQQMHDSLQSICKLPKDLLICCTHEYTQANLAFASEVDPGNLKIKEHQKQVNKLRAQGHPSLPTNLALELQINPFLRASDPGIQSQLLKKFGVQPADNQESFAMLRRWKDNY